jgi:hypothetical protein
MGAQYGTGGGLGTTQGYGTQFGYSQQPGFGVQQFTDPRSFISRQEYMPSNAGYTLQNIPENIGMGMVSSFSPNWGTSLTSPALMHQDPYAINRSGYTTQLNDPASFIHQTQYTPNRAGYTLLNAPENVGMSAMGSNLSSFASPAISSWSNPYLASQSAYTPNRAGFMLQNVPESSMMSRSF